MLGLVIDASTSEWWVRVVHVVDLYLSFERFLMGDLGGKCACGGFAMLN